MKMPPLLGPFLRQNWPIIAVLMLALVAALWFGGLLVAEFVYFNDPRHQDSDLKAWMTPKYVVMSYDLPRQVVADALGLEGPDQRGMRMREIADQMGLTLSELTERVRASAAAFRAQSQ